MGMSASGVAAVTAGATAMVGMALAVIVHAPAPEPGYHPPFQIHDPLAAVVVSLASAGLCVTLSAIRLRDIL
jgi:hypothetical protein